MPDNQIWINIHNIMYVLIGKGGGVGEDFGQTLNLLISLSFFLLSSVCHHEVVKLYNALWNDYCLWLS